MGELSNTALMPGEAAPPVPATDDELEQLEAENNELRRRISGFNSDLLAEDWTLDKVRRVVNEHDAGDGYATVRLKRVLTKDARVEGALGQRTSAPVGLPIRVSSSGYYGGTGTGEIARSECEAMFSPRSTTCPPSLRRAILEDCVMGGRAIVQNLWTPREDGERIDLTLELWPLEQSFWNQSIGRWTLITRDHGLLPIEHGHGRWLIFEPWGPRSWFHGAVRTLGMPWSDRAYAQRYRASHAKAHGSPSAIGELPTGMPINGPDGKAFQRLIMALRDGRPAAIRPAGSKTEYLEVTHDSWRIFDSIVKNTGEDIQIALLGQSGTGEKGNVYTATKGPFNGVRSDYVQADCTGLEVPLQTGAIRPWTALNFGLEWTPEIAHEVPDPEEDLKHASALRKHQGFAIAVRRYREAGFVVDAEVAARIAKDFSIDKVPVLGAIPAGQKPLLEPDDSIAPDVGARD